jgi:hypothetical protein
MMRFCAYGASSTALDAEVAARDRRRRRPNDRFNVLCAESFSIFATTSIGNQRPKLGDVLRAAHEAQRQVSRSCSTANVMSSRSLSVIDGGNRTPGRFMPLWLINSRRAAPRKHSRLRDVEDDDVDSRR